jgi:glyoxylase-like metal-dependent hydrolase (beta-lactamase superfamily II)
MLLVGAACTAVFAYAQEPRNRGAQNAAGAAQAEKPNNADVHLLHVRGNVSMMVGTGGNITVQAGDQGILLVDTGVATMSDKVLQAIRQLSSKPLTYIINTNDSDDHIGGNAALATGGRPKGNAAMDVNIIAFVTILDRMSAPTGQTAPTPEDAWPNNTYSGPQRNLHFNGEAVQIFHQPSNTDGNSVVLFRGSDVVSTGDIFDPTQYPIIDLKKGGSIQGVLEGLNRLKEMVVPENHYEGGTMVIPGHGGLCDAADVAVYQQMVTIVRDRLQDLIKQGMTLDQIKAAKPTQDFDPIYGSNAGNWTTEMFIEAAYKSLSSKGTSRNEARAN